MKQSILNVSATVQLFRSLAFVVHPDMSVLASTEKIQYLEVITDSRELSV